MKTYALSIVLQGPGGAIKAPLVPSTVDAESIQDVLSKIQLPDMSMLGVQITEFRIVQMQSSPPEGKD